MTYRKQVLAKLQCNPVTSPYNQAQLLYLNALMLGNEVDFNTAITLADQDVLANLSTVNPTSERVQNIDTTVTAYINSLNRAYNRH